MDLEEEPDGPPGTPPSRVRTRMPARRWRVEPRNRENGCGRKVRRAGPGSRDPRSHRPEHAPPRAPGGCGRPPDWVLRGCWRGRAASPARGTGRTCRPVRPPRRGNAARSREQTARAPGARPTATASTDFAACVSYSAFRATPSRPRHRAGRFSPVPEDQPSHPKASRTGGRLRRRDHLRRPDPAATGRTGQRVGQ